MGKKYEIKKKFSPGLHSPGPRSSPQSFPPVPSVNVSHSCGWSPSWRAMAGARVEGSRVGAVVEVEGAPDALRGQTESGGGTVAGYGTAYGGTASAVGAVTVAGGVRAATAAGQPG